MEAKFQKYLELIESTQDEFGFIESQECDSLLFSGLVGCVPEVTVTINAAFDPAMGQWYRRPTNCSCYPDGSKSTISRDMLLGLLWYAYYNGRKDILEQVIKHALSHWGMMGQAIDWKMMIGRCFIGPGLLGTFAAALHALGGKDYWYLRWIPADVGGAVTDFEAHLQVLHIMLRQRITGKLSARNQSVLKAQADRQPNNPLFQIAINNHDAALAILAREDLWPSDRLPRESDRESQWLPQRDEGADWKPANSSKTHSGGDFIFCFWLIKGR